MYGGLQQHLIDELKSIEEAGLYKKERIIASPQDALITLSDGNQVLNFCANNYRFWFYRQLARPHNHIEKGAKQNGTPQRIHMHVCHGLHLFPIDIPSVFGIRVWH